MNFPWTRYWYPRGDRPVLADDYLVPLEDKMRWRSAQIATLKRLPDPTDVNCLVLLGDPGTGKSYEIAKEADRLGNAAVGGLVVKRLDLKLRTESLIEKTGVSQRGVHRLDGGASCARAFL